MNEGLPMCRISVPIIKVRSLNKEIGISGSLDVEWPTKMWEQFRKITKFDRHDIVAAHSITKRDADILYMGPRKIHYNVMRFKDTMTSDEADALAGRAKTVAAQHYVLHDLRLFVLAPLMTKRSSPVGLGGFPGEA
jgi:hypothetical protein